MNKNNMMKFTLFCTALMGCDYGDGREPLISECSKEVMHSDYFNDNTEGTVIATRIFPPSKDYQAHALFFIDTDGNKKTAEYVGRINAYSYDYAQLAAQAFNAEQTGMKKTIAKWACVLNDFQAVQKEKE